MSESTFSSLVERAGDLTEILCNPEDFASDVTRAACLMQHEGFEYHFIHKSVVEFHAASFIRRSSEEIAHRFYAAMNSQRWQKWRQELFFLAQIDRVRYLRYFYVPSAIETMKRYEVELNYETVERLLNLITVMVEDGKRLLVPNVFQMDAMSGFVEDEIVTNFMHATFRGLRAKPEKLPEVIAPIGLGSYLASTGKSDFAVSVVRDVVRGARTALQHAEAELARESRVLDFLSP